MWLGAGNTPTRFFHGHTIARHRKIFICPLDHEGQVLVAKERKAEAFYGFFDEIMGTPATRANVVNIHQLDLPRLN
jgi:hypothetical protein